MSPWFDQESPDIEVLELIAEEDNSQPYELDATAVFRAVNGKFLVVYVSGCSCWPSRGSTSQSVCHTPTEVDRALSGSPWLKDQWQNWLRKDSLKVKTIYETVDGAQFDDYGVAQEHERVLSIENWLNVKFDLENQFVNRSLTAFEIAHLFTDEVARAEFMRLLS
jgi:hypothetical protein